MHKFKVFNSLQLNLRLSPTTTSPERSDSSKICKSETYSAQMHIILYFSQKMQRHILIIRQKYPELTDSNRLQLM